jgi:hypothetical protein
MMPPVQAWNSSRMASTMMRLAMFGEEHDVDENLRGRLRHDGAEVTPFQGLDSPCDGIPWRGPGLFMLPLWDIGSQFVLWNLPKGWTGNVIHFTFGISPWTPRHVRRSSIRKRTCPASTESRLIQRVPGCF